MENEPLFRNLTAGNIHCARSRLTGFVWSCDGTLFALSTQKAAPDLIDALRCNSRSSLISLGRSCEPEQLNRGYVYHSLRGSRKLVIAPRFQNRAQFDPWFHDDSVCRSGI